MARTLVMLACLSLAGAAVDLGCSARGKVAVSGESTTASASGSSDTNAWSENGPASTPPPPPSPAPAPSPSASVAATVTAAPAPPPSPPPGCGMVCNVANRGRIAPADESRFAAALAVQVESFRSCTRGHVPSMTLRFDSQGTLTSFGVDVDGTAEGSPEDVCLENAQQQRPQIQFTGPSTVRCAERCSRLPRPFGVSAASGGPQR